MRPAPSQCIRKFDAKLARVAGPASQRPVRRKRRSVPSSTRQVSRPVQQAPVSIPIRLRADRPAPLRPCGHAQRSCRSRPSQLRNGSRIHEQVGLALPLQRDVGPDPGMAEEIVAEAEGEARVVQEGRMLGGKPLAAAGSRRLEALGLGLAQVELDAVAEQRGVAAEADPAGRLVRVDRVAAGELAQPEVVVAQQQDLRRADAAAPATDGRSPCGCRSHGRRNRPDGSRYCPGRGRSRAGRPGSAPPSPAAGRAGRAHRRRRSIRTPRGTAGGCP